jgi:hypothetical protein
MPIFAHAVQRKGVRLETKKTYMYARRFVEAAAGGSDARAADMGNGGRRRLKVLLTVDTELWPLTRQWPSQRLDKAAFQRGEAFDRYVIGATATGNFGLPFIFDVLRQHRLKGVFFVESLFASAVGIEPLRNIVGLCNAAMQQVQLHAHTEWLSDIDVPGLPRPYRQNIREFAFEEQLVILQQALKNLTAAGAKEPAAFRAGNFGGNADTIAAVGRLGLKYDLSLDPTRQPDIVGVIGKYRQRRAAANESRVSVLPLTCIRVFHGGWRPAQLTALSFGELQGALSAAYENNWPCFVILLHSFEFLNGVSKFDRKPTPHHINISRFQRLCDFLEQHADCFETADFTSLCEECPYSLQEQCYQPTIGQTSWRMVQQLASRFL